VADTLRAEVDIRGLAADLKLAGGGLDHELGLVVHDAARDAADGGKARMRRGLKDWRVGPGKVQLPHIADTYRATGGFGLTAEITSDHPAAPVWEFGGIVGPIHPRSHREFIIFPKLAPVHEAAYAGLSLFEAHLQAAVDRLLATFNL